MKQELETMNVIIGKWIDIPLASETDGTDALLALDNTMNNWQEELESAFADIERAAAAERELSTLLLNALQAVLKSVSLRIDDPRIAHFDAARAAVARATGGGE